MIRKTILLMIVISLICIAISAVSEGYDDELYIEDITESDPLSQSEGIHDSDGATLITITCAGDFTIGKNAKSKKDIFGKELKAQGNDINFPFRNIRSILMNDDLTLINFEGTFTESTYIPPEKRGNDFLFSAPPSYVTMLPDNGVEAVSLENNHVMDHGTEGYEDTKRTLREAGVIYSNSSEPGIIQVKDVQICMLSYYCIDRYDKPIGEYSSLWEKVPADITAAKKLYPIVIVSFHWGFEKDYSPRENQIRMGHLAVDSGADLVIGHHSHRINPIEEYNGVYICYSLGNFCFAGNNKPSDMTSYLFQVRFSVKNGETTNKGFIIIPITISSRSDRNDFIPTPITKESTITSMRTILNENGMKLQYPVKEYPLTWN